MGVGVGVRVGVGVGARVKSGSGTQPINQSSREDEARVDVLVDVNLMSAFRRGLPNCSTRGLISARCADIPTKEDLWLFSKKAEVDVPQLGMAMHKEIALYELVGLTGWVIVWRGQQQHCCYKSPSLPCRHPVVGCLPQDEQPQ